MTAAWNMTKTELKLYLRDPMAMFFTPAAGYMSNC